MPHFRAAVALLGSMLAAFASTLAEEPAPGPRPAPPAEYKIVFWFAKRDPIQSFHHRVYDLRKGEYTPAVDQWLAMIAKRYPGYAAFVRPLRIGPGKPENVQVSEAVTRELFVIASSYGGVPAEVLLSPTPRWPYPGPGLTIGSGSQAGGSGLRMSLKPIPPVDGAPGSGGASPLAPSPYPFPVPYPYPRPHP